MGRGARSGSPETAIDDVRVAKRADDERQVDAYAIRERTLNERDESKMGRRVPQRRRAEIALCSKTRSSRSIAKLSGICAGSRRRYAGRSAVCRPSALSHLAGLKLAGSPPDGGHRSTFAPRTVCCAHTAAPSAFGSRMPSDGCSPRRDGRSAARPKAAGRDRVARDAGDHPSMVPRAGGREVRRHLAPRGSRSAAYGRRGGRAAADHGA
jgi:hypothetical protein